MSGGLFHSVMHPAIKNTLFILLAAVTGPTSAQPVQLTTDPVNHSFPRFSPDGEWILYTREGEGGDTLIYKISANGGFEIPVAPSGGNHFNPNWSSDGRTICCEKIDTTGYRQIYTIRADGTGEQGLTSEPVDHMMPVFSPDDNWIAYYRRAPDLPTQIFKISSEGGEEVHLADGEHACNAPQWSPDGEWIVYERVGAPFPRRQIAMLHWSGGEEMHITSDESGNHYRPCWSPDSRWIVYMHYDDAHGLQLFKHPIPAMSVSPGMGSPNGYSLEQNFPNPFNASTRIGFNIPALGHVTVFLHDSRGRTVKILINRSLSPGEHHFSIDATAIPSGLYFYTLRAGSVFLSRKMLIMR